MTIHFLCPQGHPLTAEDQQAGAEAKCPSCGVLLIIPDAIAPAEDFDSSDAVTNSPPRTGQFPAAGPRLSGSPRRPEKIVFYCPNGHKLNGPASLQGKRGQCPHCSAQFVIPIEEDADTEIESPPQPTTVPSSVQSAAVNPPFFPPSPPPESITEFPPIGVDDDIPVGEIVDDDRVENAYSFADASREPLDWQDFFMWLWRFKANDACVDIMLSDGERLRPQLFWQAMSVGDFAVFATRDGGDTYSLRAIRWADIKQVVCREVREVPDGFI